MNYEAMSDFEINNAVGEAIFGESLEDGFEFEWRKASSLFEGSEAAELFIHNGSGFYREASVDYCNNPADMWSIIVGSGISLLQQDNGEGWCAFRWDNDDAESWHINPLRAAATVYLKMMEQKK
ncbi:NinX [Vibrio phage 1.076.O._10N.286.51.B7]|nr:NinX [Vibrio phage 1.076.O._10N.286.51.B7]